PPHRHERRRPRPAAPTIRKPGCRAQQRRADRRHLSWLLADEDQRAVLRDAEGRARHEPHSDLLRRRRPARAQPRPDARPRHGLRAGSRLEEQADRPRVRQVRRQQRRRHHHLDLQAAGAAVLSLPSSELYAAMQTGACDAALTSSTSLTSFRLEELAKHLTTGRNKSYWFMLEPLLMSKAVFDRLSSEEREIIMSVGAELEEYGRAAAVEDDVRVAKVYEAAGAKVHDLDEAVVQKWRDLARETAWKDYANKSENCARLLKLAVETGA